MNNNNINKINIDDFAENTEAISITSIMKMYDIDINNLSDKKKISKMFKEKFRSYTPQKKDVERVIHFYCIHKDEIENNQQTSNEFEEKNYFEQRKLNKNLVVIKKHLNSEFYSMKLNNISAKIILCKSKTGLKYNDIHLKLVGYEKLLYNDKGFCDIQFFPFVLKGHNKERILQSESIIELLPNTLKQYIHLDVENHDLFCFENGMMFFNKDDFQKFEDGFQDRLLNEQKELQKRLEENHLYLEQTLNDEQYEMLVGKPKTKRKQIIQEIKSKEIKEPEKEIDFQAIQEMIELNLKEYEKDLKISKDINHSTKELLISLCEKYKVEIENPYHPSITKQFLSNKLQECIRPKKVDYIYKN